MDNVERVQRKLIALDTARKAYSRTNGPLLGDTVLACQQLEIIRNAFLAGDLNYSDVKNQLTYCFEL